MSAVRMAARLGNMKTTVFSEFTALCIANNAANLGQGFPDWNAPEFVKRAATSAIQQNHNQYTRSAGYLPLVTTLGRVYTQNFGFPVSATENIIVTCGATQAMYLALQTLVNPGDEVILMEPFYDAYPNQVVMAGGIPKYVSLRPDPGATSANAWKFDGEEFRGQVSSKTKVIVLNTPHNPLGKVFDRAEMEFIAAIVRENPQITVVTDEVYEHIVFGMPSNCGS